MEFEEAKEKLQDILDYPDEAWEKKGKLGVEYFLKLANKINNKNEIKELIRNIGAPYGLPIELSVFITEALLKYIKEE